MNKNLLPIHFAPLQGYTDAAYRQAHACIFGGIDTYYSPFVRVEHGEIRRKDIRDITRVQTLHIRKIVLKIEIAAAIAPVREILESVHTEMQRYLPFKQLIVHYDVDPA